MNWCAEAYMMFFGYKHILVCVCVCDAAITASMNEKTRRILTWPTGLFHNFVGIANWLRYLCQRWTSLTINDNRRKKKTKRREDAIVRIGENANGTQQIFDTIWGINVADEHIYSLQVSLQFKCWFFFHFILHSFHCILNHTSLSVTANLCTHLSDILYIYRHSMPFQFWSSNFATLKRFGICQRARERARFFFHNIIVKHEICD